MRPFRSIFAASVTCFLFFAVLLLACGSAMAQPRRERLVLKDGTWQVVTKYEVKGDRVRFYSAERDDWEEIPNDLVDWVATAKWNRDHTPGAAVSTDPDDPQQSEAAKLDAEEFAARNAEKARIPVILPGLRLPDESGVWMLDTFQGEPELVHALQANGDLNRATEHSILRATLGSSSGAKELIHVEGAGAKVQLHVNDPAIYVSLDPPGASKKDEDTAPDAALTVDTHGASSAVKDKNSHSSPESRYAILRLRSSHNLRTAVAMQVALLAQPGHSEDIVETNKEILPGGLWMKITPKIPLLIGEYALIEILSPREVNLDVWDFGINPRALENKHPRLAVGSGR